MGHICILTEPKKVLKSWFVHYGKAKLLTPLGRSRTPQSNKFVFSSLMSPRNRRHIQPSSACKCGPWWISLVKHWGYKSQDTVPFRETEKWINNLRTKWKIIHTCLISERVSKKCRHIFILFKSLSRHHMLQYKWDLIYITYQSTT